MTYHLPLTPLPPPQVREDAVRGRYVGGAVTNWTLVSLNHDTQMVRATWRHIIVENFITCCGPHYGDKEDGLLADSTA